MARTLAGTILVVLAVILFNVYREGGAPALRSWAKAKFLNQPSRAA
jgi:hypothetical protein